MGVIVIVFLDNVDGLYGQYWKSRTTPETSLHPAKFSKGLIYHILQAGKDKGYWKPGQICLDCFGGVGLGGIAAADLDLQWVGIEIEQRFVDIGRANFEKNKDLWLSKPKPVLIHGDSRDARRLIGNADFVVTSPPYINVIGSKATGDEARERQRKRFLAGKFKTSRPDVLFSQKNLGAQAMYSNTYGKTDGQIGTLREGDIDEVLADLDGAVKVGDTYWAATARVYKECYDTLLPGTMMALVTKDFVRKGQIVQLGDTTIRLLTEIGFKLEGITYASLTTKNGKKYISQWKRLAEAKGSPKIDFENVIWVRR